MRPLLAAGFAFLRTMLMPSACWDAVFTDADSNGPDEFAATGD
jgi:hypothetical protein